MTSVLIEVSPGELIDKITILQIKLARFDDEAKIENVRRELKTLEHARDRQIDLTPEVMELTRKLSKTNETLWEIENQIRQCEARSDFTHHFIELARNVYKTNDVRASLKRQMNGILGSALSEEKQYSDYLPRQNPAHGNG